MTGTLSTCLRSQNKIFFQKNVTFSCQKQPSKIQISSKLENFVTFLSVRTRESP